MKIVDFLGVIPCSLVDTNFLDESLASMYTVYEKKLGKKFVLKWVKGATARL
jgi:hypothetical protein